MTEIINTSSEMTQEAIVQRQEIIAVASMSAHDSWLESGLQNGLELNYGRIGKGRAFAIPGCAILKIKELDNEGSLDVQKFQQTIVGSLEKFDLPVGYFKHLDTIVSGVENGNAKYVVQYNKWLDAIREKSFDDGTYGTTIIEFLSLKRNNSEQVKPLRNSKIREKLQKVLNQSIKLEEAFGSFGNLSIDGYMEVFRLMTGSNESNSFAYVAHRNWRKDREVNNSDDLWDNRYLNSSMSMDINSEKIMEIVGAENLASYYEGLYERIQYTTLFSVPEKVTSEFIRKCIWQPAQLAFDILKKGDEITAKDMELLEQYNKMITFFGREYLKDLNKGALKAVIDYAGERM